MRNPFTAEMFEQVLDRKHLRLLAAMPFAVLLISSCQALSVPNGCLRVVAHAKKMTTEGMTIDLRLLPDIMDCAKELHKLYRTDWKEIPSMIPNAVINVVDIICSVPNPGEKALNGFTRNQNLLFMPLCSLYKVMNTFHQAMSLQMGYKMYRREFERLQMELQFLLDQTQDELLPNWQSSSTTALQKTSTELFRKLDHFSAELKELLRIIQSSINKGQINRDLAVSSAQGSLWLCGLSIVTGTLPLAVFSGAVGVLSLASNVALTQTIQRLESLQRDVEITCKQIEGYRTFLAHEISQTRRGTPISVVLLVALVTCLCIICLYLVVCIVERGTGGAKPMGETERRRLEIGQVRRMRQRKRRAPRVQSASAGIVRFRTVRLLKRVKYAQGQKRTVSTKLLLLSNRKRKVTTDN